MCAPVISLPSLTVGCACLGSVFLNKDVSFDRVHSGTLLASPWPTKMQPVSIHTNQTAPVSIYSNQPVGVDG